MARPAAHTITVATPERILNAAEREFSELGFGGATLATIARGAQITRASLLHHFPSKEELYQRTVERAFSDLGQALTHQIAAEGAFVNRFLQVMKTFHHFCEIRPGVARLLVRQVIEREGPGRTLLLEQAVPLLDVVEGFIASEGKDLLREGLPIRSALLRVVTNTLLRASADNLRTPLWGDTADVTFGVDHDWHFICFAFLKDEVIADVLASTARLGLHQASSSTDESSVEETH